MGIELPSPQGEQVGSSRSVEKTTPLGQIETAPFRQNVEINATEVPASQELRTGHGVGDGQGPVMQSDVSNATQAGTSTAQQPVPVSLDDIPVVAADEDLIEKQWVDSVKRVIKETQSDPYRQGEAISRLQADYLQKRYGKTIGGGSNA